MSIMNVDILLSLATAISTGAIVNALYSLISSYKRKKKLLKTIKNLSNIKISYIDKDGSKVEFDLNPKNEASIRHFIKTVSEEVENGT